MGVTRKLILEWVIWHGRVYRRVALGTARIKVAPIVVVFVWKKQRRWEHDDDDVCRHLYHMSHTRSLF